MKSELIDNKAYISLSPNSPGELFHILNNIPGVQTFSQEIKKIEHNLEIAAIYAIYKQVDEGLWYIKSKYDFHFATELVINADEAEPYYEMEYFLLEDGKLSLSAGEAVSLKNKMMFSNSSKALKLHMDKGTCVTSYKFLFTKKFLDRNFYLNDPVLQESIPGGILNFKKAFYTRAVHDEEVVLLRELNALKEGAEIEFLQTVAIKSCSMQLLQIFFKEQLLSGIAPETDSSVFINVLSLLQQHTRKPFPGVEKLATAANMSVSSFKRKFTERFKTTPESYFRKMQMDEAEKLLKKPNSNIKEVAHHFGFASPQNFRTAFKKIKGYLPGKAV